MEAQNTRISEAIQFAEGFMASIILFSLLEDTKNLSILDRSIELESLATMILVNYPPIEE